MDILVYLRSWACRCSSPLPALPEPLHPPATTRTTQPPPPPASDAASPTGNQLQPVPGAFDIDRVRLMEPADLPDDVPVAVPFGGEVDDSISVFEGQSLHVTYDARFFNTAAAFYAAWFEREGLSASPLLSFADPSAGWEVIVDGEPVRVQITLSPDEAQTQLTITLD